MTIGILALQGDVEKHVRILDQLNLDHQLLRYPHELQNVDGLIIPGGESTTLTCLIQKNALYAPIKNFAKVKPVLGTCAGLIMMAKNVHHPLVTPLDLIDMDVDRNAYGRQVHSFVDDLTINLQGKKQNIKATFIRAPKITRIGDQVQILAEYDQQPCAVQQGIHIALAFHPELSAVDYFHKLIFMDQKSKKYKTPRHAA